MPCCIAGSINNFALGLSNMRYKHAISSCFGVFAFISSMGQVSVNQQTFSDHEQTISPGEPLSEADHYIYLAKRRSAVSTGRYNVFVFSRQKKFNLALFLVKSSTGFSSLFNKKIRVVKIKSPEQLAQKIVSLMENNPDKMIGNLWFDSHGIYITGHSLMIIGKDTINYQTIVSERIRRSLSELSAYCDEKSTITIGACYSAASFVRPANDKLKGSRMNGDSLMKELGDIFPLSPIFGSMSWIMTKPFLLGKKWGLAGYPMDLKFRDEIYKPAWERMGMWRMYDPITLSFRDLNTVYLDSDGSIKENTTSYLDFPKAQRKQQKNLKKLKPGMYKFEFKQGVN